MSEKPSGTASGHGSPATDAVQAEPAPSPSPQTEAAPSGLVSASAQHLSASQQGGQRSRAGSMRSATGQQPAHPVLRVDPPEATAAVLESSASARLSQSGTLRSQNVGRSDSAAALQQRRGSTQNLSRRASDRSSRAATVPRRGSTASRGSAGSAAAPAASRQASALTASQQQEEAVNAVVASIAGTVRSALAQDEAKTSGETPGSAGISPDAEAGGGDLPLEQALARFGSVASATDVGAAAAAAGQQSVSKAEQSVDVGELQQENSRLNGKVESLLADRERLQDEVAEQKRRIKELERERDGLRKEAASNASASARDGRRGSRGSAVSAAEQRKAAAAEQRATAAEEALAEMRREVDTWRQKVVEGQQRRRSSDALGRRAESDEGLAEWGANRRAAEQIATLQRQVSEQQDELQKRDADAAALDRRLEKAHNAIIAGITWETDVKLEKTKGALTSLLCSVGAAESVTESSPAPSLMMESRRASRGGADPPALEDRRGSGATGPGAAAAADGEYGVYPEAAPGGSVAEAAPGDGAAAPPPSGAAPSSRSSSAAGVTLPADAGPQQATFSAAPGLLGDGLVLQRRCGADAVRVSRLGFDAASGVLRDHLGGRWRCAGEMLGRVAALADACGVPHDLPLPDAPPPCRLVASHHVEQGGAGAVVVPALPPRWQPARRAAPPAASLRSATCAPPVYPHTSFDLLDYTCRQVSASAATLYSCPASAAQVSASELLYSRSASVSAAAAASAATAASSAAHRSRRVQSPPQASAAFARRTTGDPYAPLQAYFAAHPGAARSPRVRPGAYASPTRIGAHLK